MALVTAKARTFPLAGASALLFDLICYNVYIGRVASVCAGTALTLDVPSVFQIIQRTLYRAPREAQVAGNGFHTRPAAPAACAVAEIHIDRSRPVRQVGIGVDGAEKAHLSP